MNIHMVMSQMFTRKKKGHALVVRFLESGFYFICYSWKLNIELPITSQHGRGSEVVDARAKLLAHPPRSSFGEKYLPGPDLSLTCASLTSPY